MYYIGEISPQLRYVRSSVRSRQEAPGVTMHFMSLYSSNNPIVLPFRRPKNVDLTSHAGWPRDNQTQTNNSSCNTPQVRISFSKLTNRVLMEIT